jgi:hypothetical protein
MGICVISVGLASNLVLAQLSIYPLLQPLKNSKPQACSLAYSLGCMLQLPDVQLRVNFQGLINHIAKGLIFSVVK